MGVDDGRGPVVVRLCPGDATAALAEAGRLLAAGRAVVVALDPHRRADVGTVGALARLALTARRAGAELVVQAPDAALPELAELVGLAEVLGLPAGPAGAGSGQAQR
jgi:ABC-type transporter Mla MlaB component